MSLTKAQMDWLDEQPTIRNVPAVMTFRRAPKHHVSTSDLYAEERRAVRKRQLDQMARELEREERL